MLSLVIYLRTWNCRVSGCSHQSLPFKLCPNTFVGTVITYSVSSGSCCLRSNVVIHLSLFHSLLCGWWITCNMRFWVIVRTILEYEDVVDVVNILDNLRPCSSILYSEGWGASYWFSFVVYALILLIISPVNNRVGLINKVSWKSLVVYLFNMRMIDCVRRIAREHLSCFKFATILIHDVGLRRVMMSFVEILRY